MPFGSGDLGMGISITLIDEFSEPGRRVVQGFTTIEDATTRLGAKTFLLNQFQQGLGMVENALNSLTDSGQAFDQNLMELSALTGVVGPGLDDIGDKAMVTAQRFGGDAVAGVDTFKNILGKLGPEIAQNSAALQQMGVDAFALSKGMNNDLGGATAALTTSMNIYAGSMTDPVQMAAEMTRQMNAMAAGAKVGSAEVTDIAASIRTGGLAAKTAGLSFEELNSLIQIMGKGAVYGSEAGVAIRNVLGIMSQGEYLPKKALQGLQAAGVDLNMIGDISQPIEARLREISKIQNDAALVNLVFGRENSNAFRVLAGNLGLMNDWTAQMTGTNEATDQAAVVMQSFSERMRRVRATVQGYAIDLFMATKSVLPFVQGTLSAAQGLVSLGPAYLLAKAGVDAWRASSIMTSVANMGLTATFTDLAAAAWAATLPLLPYIAVIGAVVGAVWLAYKGVQSFQDLLNGGVQETGFWGVIQQIGGVVMGVVEAFQTWDGVGFSFSENMRANLEKIGVLDLVLRLATWVVRVKEFFTGLGTEMGRFAGFVGTTFGQVWSKIGPVFTLFDEWGLTISKLTGDVWGFHGAGQAIGQLLSVVWKPLIYVVAAGFGVLMLAVKLAGAVIGGFIWYVETSVRLLGALYDAAVSVGSYLAGPMWTDIAGAAGQFITWLMGIPDLMRNVGEHMVTAIGEGLSNAWGGLAQLLLSLVHALPFGDQISDFFGLGGGGQLRLTGAAGGGAGPARIGAAMAESRAVAATQRPIVMDHTTREVKSITNITNLDGREIYRTVQDLDQEHNDRN